MINDIFRKLPVGRIALKKLSPVSEDFVIYIVEILQGDGKDEKAILKVTGADFIRIKNGRNKGLLSNKIKKGSKRVTYICNLESEDVIDVCDHEIVTSDLLNVV